MKVHPVSAAHFRTQSHEKSLPAKLVQMPRQQRCCNWIWLISQHSSCGWQHLQHPLDCEIRNDKRDELSVNLNLAKGYCPGFVDLDDGPVMVGEAKCLFASLDIFSEANEYISHGSLY